MSQQPGQPPRPPTSQQPVHPVHPAHPAQQQRPIPAIPAQPRPAAPQHAQPAHPHHPGPGGGGAKVAGMPMQAAPSKDDHSLDPIALIDDFDTASDTSPTSKIKAFGVAGTHATHTYKRQTYATGQGACRVRSFHGRLSDEGMSYMDEKINEWLDNHPEIEVKIVTTSIGQYEGKIKEPALVVNVWY